jgi:hypothetical protein
LASRGVSRELALPEGLLEQRLMTISALSIFILSALVFHALHLQPFVR